MFFIIIKSVFLYKSLTFINYETIPPFSLQLRNCLNIVIPVFINAVRGSPELKLQEAFLNYFGMTREPFSDEEISIDLFSGATRGV